MSQIYQSRAESEGAASMESASNSTFLAAAVKHYAGATADLTDVERVALDYQFGALLTLWENDHFQYQQGYLPEEHWAKTVWNMKCNFGSTYYRELLDTGGWALRESFRDVVARIAIEATSDPLDYWDEY